MKTQIVIEIETKDSLPVVFNEGDNEKNYTAQEKKELIKFRKRFAKETHEVIARIVKSMIEEKVIKNDMDLFDNLDFEEQYVESWDELKDYGTKIQIKKRGFITRAFIMTGLPGENKDSAKHMIDFLEKTNPDVVTFTSFIPLPGCDIYNSSSKYGVEILNQDWNKYDIALKWEASAPFVHKINSLSFKEMENNREKIKEYLFNKKKSNIPIYNREYKSKVVDNENNI